MLNKIKEDNGKEIVWGEGILLLRIRTYFQINSVIEQVTFE